MDPMERVRARIVFKHVFWAALAAETKVIPVPGDHPQIKTMATDMKSIFYNVDWFAAQTPGVQEFGFVHELAHKFALHGLRRQMRHPLLWNIAGDHEINLRLQEAGFEVWSKACCDSKFAEMQAEQIYELLKKEAQDEGGSGGEGEGKGTPEPGGMGEDILDAPGMSDAEKEEVRQQVMSSVARAATMARQAGQMSAGLERFVDGILKPKVAWWDELRVLTRRLVREEENWSVRSRRIRNIYMPGLKSYRMGEIVVIGDTSGSISNDDMKMIAGIAMDCMDELRPSLMRCIWWDYNFCGEQEFMAGERPLIIPKGGGGTDMVRALKYVEDNYEPEAVILITDGETPWPDHEMPWPLLVLTTHRPSPIGTSIKIEV
jgi:predicted metal-dependent peptidase